MLKGIREKLQGFLHNGIAPITEDSTLHEITLQYPDAYDFIERKYAIRPSPEEKTVTLKEFSNQFGLPPPQILFMEIQMDARSRGVKELTPEEATVWMKNVKECQILDVREEWEIKLCKLPNSKQLTAEVLDHLLAETPKDAPILLYCHFGVRSLDAAHFLVDRGFTNVVSLRGGIDAWSIDIDPNIPRYQNAYC